MQLWIKLAQCLLVANLTLSALAQVSDPIEILKKADAAARAVKAVSYKVRIEPRGLDKDRQFILTGTVSARQPADGKPLQYNIDGKGVTPVGEREVRFQIISDGEQIIRITKLEKTAQIGRLPESAELLGGTISFMLVQEFFHPAPFQDELKGVSRRHDGTRNIAGVDCDIIYAKYADDAGETYWFLGRKDHLPRRADRLAGTTTFTVTISDLNVHPQFDADTFAVKAPEGFKVEKHQPRATGEDERPKLLPNGTPAPGWALKTAGGQAVTMRALRGKVVLLCFWASQEPECRMAMPVLQKLHEKYADQPVAVYAVNAGERGDPLAVMKEHKCTYGLLLRGERVARLYNVPMVPVYYVIGADGKIFFWAVGHAPEAEGKLIEVIDEALEQHLAGQKK